MSSFKFRYELDGFPVFVSRVKNNGCSLKIELKLFKKGAVVKEGDDLLDLDLHNVKCNFNVSGYVNPNFINKVLGFLLVSSSNSLVRTCNYDESKINITADCKSIYTKRVLFAFESLVKANPYSP